MKLLGKLTDKDFGGTDVISYITHQPCVRGLDGTDLLENQIDCFKQYLY